MLSSAVIWHTYGLTEDTRFSGLMYHSYMYIICQEGMDWQKFILQKDKVYYFKYREC